jgi:hypothetical protein
LLIYQVSGRLHQKKLHPLTPGKVMALPIMMLQKLKMRLSEKIGLCFVFAVVLIDVLLVSFELFSPPRSVQSTVADKNTLLTILDPIVAMHDALLSTRGREKATYRPNSQSLS